MKKDDFKNTMEELLKALTALHERLLRVETWMINHEKRAENEEREKTS